MASNPLNLDPKDIKKLIVEGLEVRSDGAYSVKRLVTSDDPAVSEQEMRQFRQLMREHFESADVKAQRVADEQVKAEERRQLEEILLPVKKERPPRAESMAAAFAAYMATKSGIAPSTKKSYKESFELFALLVGGEDRQTDEVTDAELMAFNEALAFVPLHATKRGFVISKADEQIQKPKPKFTLEDGTTMDAPMIAAGSANGHRRNMLSFVDFLISSLRRSGSNALEKSQRHSDGEEEGGAEPFTEDELRRIFDPSTFLDSVHPSPAKGKRGRKTERPHMYWGPLLALYTGARANEIACLDVTDFIVQDDIPCIQIRHIPRKRPNAIMHAPASTKRTKNKSSRRLIPIHPDLYELGLADYLDDLREINATRLFPHLPMDSRQKRERYLSRDVNDYLKTIGVHEHRAKVLHSFRDTVSDMLGVSDMDEVQADQWTGHKNQSVKGRHYRSIVAVTQQAKRGFEALSFPYLDLDALRYPKGCWNDWLSKNMVP